MLFFDAGLAAVEWFADILPTNSEEQGYGQLTAKLTATRVYVYETGDTRVE